MLERYPRHIIFDNIPNFRDIGGYHTRDGRTVAWRRLFRSGEMCSMTHGDLAKLKKEFGLASVIDLRSKSEVERQGIGLLTEAQIKYHNISFTTDDDDRQVEEKRYREFKNMGEFYLDLMPRKEYGRQIIQALEVIASPENHPLVFNCAVGKDRTGILAAVLLSVLGVEDKDIIEDYTLSGPYMEVLRNRITNDPQAPADVKTMPDFFWTAAPESMMLLLETLRCENGSIEKYLITNGAAPSLFRRLRKTLLIN